MDDGPPHLLWTWEAHSSWRGRQLISFHKLWGANAIRSVCRFIKLKHQVQQGNRLTREINEDMQIFMFSCDSWNDECALDTTSTFYLRRAG